jgi:hypothetical protein
MLREHSGAGRTLREHRMLPPSREHSGSTAEHGEGSGRTECFPRAENTLGATNPIERSTGPREDARGAETILLRDRRISRHSWVTQWPFSLVDSYWSAISGAADQPESSGVRRIKRTDLYTDWGALSQNVINLIASAFAIAKLAEHFYDSADSCISRMAI